MLTIVDYGVGNLASIQNMLHKIGCEALISDSLDDMRTATALILPGVGAFDHAMNQLAHQGLIEVVKEQALVAKVPLLGICLGMQLLFERSDEGIKPGLGLIPGRVTRFDFSLLPSPRPRIPHMGWNVVRPLSEDGLFLHASSTPRYYFVHSYHVTCNPKYVLATAEYGYPFACAVRSDNIMGVQFHPEKSHKFGMRLLADFVEQIC